MITDPTAGKRQSMKKFRLHGQIRRLRAVLVFIDVSEQHPEKRKEMMELWRQQRKELDIILPQDL